MKQSRVRIKVGQMSGSQLEAFAPGAMIELPNFGSVVFRVLELGEDYMVVEVADDTWT